MNLFYIVSTLIVYVYVYFCSVGLFFDESGEHMMNSDLLTCWLSGAGENEIYSSAVGSDDEQKKGSESIVKEYLSCLCTMNSIREFTQLGSLAAWSKVILCSHTTVTYACYNPPPSSAAIHSLHRMKIAM